MAAIRYNRIKAVDIVYRSSYPILFVAREIRFYTATNQGGTEFAMLGTAIGNSCGSPIYVIGNAKDNNNSTLWVSPNAEMGWWGIDSGAGNAYELNSFAILSYNEGTGCCTPKKLITESSSDGTNWTQTSAIILVSDVSDSTWQYFNVTPLGATVTQTIPAMTVY